MTRRIYESQLNIERERTVAAGMATHLACGIAKLSRAYPADWAIVRPDDSVRALMEVKVRDVPSDRYPTLILSLQKVDACLSMAQRFGLGFLVVAAYHDCVQYVVMTPELQKDLRVKMGGRTDRGSTCDIEPVVHVPHHLMRRVAWT